MDVVVMNNIDKLPTLGSYSITNDSYRQILVAANLYWRWYWFDYDKKIVVICLNEGSEEIFYEIVFLEIKPNNW